MQQSSLSNNVMLATKIFEFFKSKDCYQNALIAYRIFLTISMVVTLAEGSFINVTRWLNNLAIINREIIFGED